MSWVRLDDGFPEHPKVIGLSDKAFRAHVVALAYCARHLTDGRIPRAYPVGGKVAAELVKSGLWSEDVQGYFVHDYLEYNPSRERVMSERTAAKVRANKRRTSGEVRVPPTPTPTPTPTPRPRAVASKPRSNGAGGRPSHDQTYLVKQLMAANPEWEGAFSWAAVTKLNQKWGQEQVTEALRAAALDAGAGIESLYGWLEHRCQQESRA